MGWGVWLWRIAGVAGWLRLEGGREGGAGGRESRGGQWERGGAAGWEGGLGK